MISMSTNARPYMVMCLFGLASTFALLQALDTGRLSWWIVYAASSCCRLHPLYGCVSPHRPTCMGLLDAARRVAIPLLLANVAALLAYLPWLGGLLEDLHGPNEIGGLEPFGFKTIRNDLENWSIGSNLSLRLVPGNPAIILIAVGVAAAVIGVTLRVRRRAPSGCRRHALFWSWCSPWLPRSERSCRRSLVMTCSTSQNLIASWPGLALAVGILLTRPPARCESLPSLWCSRASRLAEPDGDLGCSETQRRCRRRLHRADRKMWRSNRGRVHLCAPPHGVRCRTRRSWTISREMSPCAPPRSTTTQ